MFQYLLVHSFQHKSMFIWKKWVNQQVLVSFWIVSNQQNFQQDLKPSHWGQKRHVKILKYFLDNFDNLRDMNWCFSTTGTNLSIGWN